MLTSKICTEMQSHAFRRRRHFHRGAQREKFFDMAKQVGACVCVEDCPMPRTTKHDVELLRWWREWLHALDAEMAVTDQGDEECRHKRVEMLQRTIAKTPSEGLVVSGSSWRSPVSLTVSLTVLTESRQCPHIATRLDC